MSLVDHVFMDTTPLKAVLNATDDVLLFVERDTRIVLSCNAAAERLFKCRAAEIVGATTEQLHPDRSGYEWLGQEVARSLLSEPSVVREVPMRRFDGSMFLARVNIFTLSSRWGSGISLSVIQEVTGATQETNLQPDAQCHGFKDLLRSLCEAHGWGYGETWLPRKEGYLEYGPTWSADPQRTDVFRGLSDLIKCGRGDGVPGRVWATGDPEWLENLQTSSVGLFRRRFSAVSIGFKSALAVPMRRDGEVRAVLMFFGDRAIPAKEGILADTQRRLAEAATKIRHPEWRDSPAEEMHYWDKSAAQIGVICEAGTYTVLDVLEGSLTQRRALQWSRRDHVADVLVRTGRHLLDRTGIEPSTGQEAGYAPYWFRVEAGGTKWGVLRTKAVRMEDARWVLEAYAFDAPPAECDMADWRNDPLGELTPRERQVLQFTFRGLSSKQLARELGISHRTVETHRTAIMRKLKVHSFVDLVSEYGAKLRF